MYEVKAGASRAQALADPTRLSIALAVRQHPRELLDRIADEVGRDQSLISRHCQKLYEVGILDRFAKGRPHYSVTDFGERLLQLLMEGPESHRP